MFPLPSSGYLPDPDIEIMVPVLAGGCFTTDPLGKPVDYYSVIKMNKIGSLLEMWMDLESVIQKRKSEREKQRLNINVYMWDQEEWYR